MQNSWSSPISAPLIWRHFILSLYLSLSLSVSLSVSLSLSLSFSLSPSAPHAQCWKLFRASYNRSHFGLPPNCSEIFKMTGLPPKIVWTMTYSYRPHRPWCLFGVCLASRHFSKRNRRRPTAALNEALFLSPSSFSRLINAFLWCWVQWLVQRFQAGARGSAFDPRWSATWKTVGQCRKADQSFFVRLAFEQEIFNFIMYLCLYPYPLVVVICIRNYQCGLG